MLFSQRYFRALQQSRLTVEIPGEARMKLWSWLAANNFSLRIQRDPNDGWISNSTILEETESELLVEHGWNQIPGAPTPKDSGNHLALRHLVMAGEAEFIFDALELAARWMESNEREALRRKINQIFEMHDCPWRLSDGEFFKLDMDFVGARLASSAHDALTANRFAGAAEEFAKARQYLAAGEVKEATYYAGHSFESVMKVLAGLDHANADKLIKELIAIGYFDDLPSSMRAGFGDQVLKALPFLRNKLGGHGQGASVVNIPSVYGELALQLAAAFHNFLIAKHIDRGPLPALDAEQDEPQTDDIPF